jgi:hypothetical protein
MGDIGSALSSAAGGIGDALSGVGSAFSGGGMGDIGSAMSSMFSGSAAPGQTTDPAQQFQQSVDPTGSVAASQAINPPGQAPTAGQNQQTNPQNQPQQPKPAAQQTPPQSAIDQLRKLLQGQQQKNPYQTGGGGGGGGGAGGGGGGGGGGSQGGEGDWLGKYTRGQGIQPSPWQDPQGTGGAPSSPLEGGSATDEPPSDQPTDIPNWRGTTPDIGSARNPRAAAAGQGAVSGATQPAQAPDVQSPGAPAIGPGSAAASGGITSIPGLGALGGVAALPLTSTPAETGTLPPTAANIPPDQRNMPYPGQQYSPDPSLPANQPTPPGTTSGPNDPRASVPGRGQPGATTALGGGPGNEEEAPRGRPSDPASAPLSKKQYEDVLKSQGVSAAEAKKRADASTPADRARAAGPDNLPTKKPSDGERPYHMDGSGRRGVSNITRDRAGMQGVPQMLGELAQAVMPLLGGLMGGGGMFGGRGRFHGRGFPWGRGGHGRFGNRFTGGHPGGHGSGMYPYHHPGMGWAGFNHHPGGGWRPLDPRYAASMGGQVGGNAALGYGGGDGSGGDMSQLAPILQALGINVPGMGGGQGGFRQGGRFGGGGGSSGGGGASGGYQGPAGPPQQGPWSSNPFLSTLVGAESGGRNGAVGDNGQAKGVFQFHDATWQRYAQNVPGASNFASAAQAPAEMQQAVAMTAPISEWGPRTKRILHAQFGNFDESMTIGQLSRMYGGGGQGNTPPGTVATGDTKAPNPNGNTPPTLPANQGPATQVTPSWSPDA